MSENNDSSNFSDFNDFNKVFNQKFSNLFAWLVRAKLNRNIYIDYTLARLYGEAKKTS